MADSSTAQRREALVKSLDGADTGTFGDDGEARKEVLEAAKRLVNRLETPREKIMKIFGEQPWVVSLLKVALDTDLFVHLGSESEPESSGFPPGKSVHDLAGLTKIDPVLLKRILKFFCAYGLVTEVPPSPGTSEDGQGSRYGATRFTRTLANPIGRSIADFHFHVNTHINRTLPSYLQTIGYKNPDTYYESAFQYAVEGGEGKTYWDWIEERDEVRRSFQGMMAFFSKADILENEGAGGSKAGKGAVTTTKPPLLTRSVTEMLSNKKPALNTAAPLFVDVGGGQGHDVENLLKHSQNTQGRLVLQDAPHIVAKARPTFEHTTVELMAHDFFKPQPPECREARIYHLGSILHDWPDSECRKILQNIRAAMKDGYSSLLLHETVLPESGLSGVQAISDLLMMVNFSAGERTRAEFDALLKSAGLQLESTWEDATELRKVLVIVPI